MSDSVFEAALEQALAERAKLDVLIASLSEQLGRETPVGIDPSPGARAGTGRGQVGHDPVSSVAEGEFLGQTGTKAAAEVLRRYGSRSHPLTTDQLYRAITRGGVKIGGPGILYRSITRNKDFIRVGRGKWGLSAWYPAGAAAKRAHIPEASGEDEPEDDSQERPDEGAA